ncbi:cysteine desulfurase family protein [Proteinivorax hydrogeniformans]|uniref:cysteine desulfurase n=1 Tax=Proteinivorax hydrogeniformans TaxID=1826727 RepID=A0AAU8HW85_9FIRM
MKSVYLDNSATTQIDEEVLQVYIDCQRNNYANPASVHSLGSKSEKLIKEAKKKLLHSLDIENQYDVLSSSGGTESNNLAILGTVGFYNKRGKKVVTTPIEHASVSEVFDCLVQQGYIVEFADVDKDGFVDVNDLKEKMDSDTVLTSIMAVNNEIGTIQPLEEIGQIVKSKNPQCIFHVDGVQGYGKIDISLERFNIDLLSISSHKFHGPKGVGALFIKEKVGLKPLIFGGGQQRGLRPGTENVPGCYAMSIAAEKMMKSRVQNNKQIAHLKEKLRDGILKKVKNSRVISPENSAPHILNIAFKNFKGEVLVRAFEEVGIYVSTGSACSSRVSDSHVLKAINLPKEFNEGAIRFSLSNYTNEQEIDYTIEKTADIIEELQLFM